MRNDRKLGPDPRPEIEPSASSLPVWEQNFSAIGEADIIKDKKNYHIHPGINREILDKKKKALKWALYERR